MTPLCIAASPSSFAAQSASSSACFLSTRNVPDLLPEQRCLDPLHYSVSSPSPRPVTTRLRRPVPVHAPWPRPLPPRLPRPVHAPSARTRHPRSWPRLPPSMRARSRAQRPAATPGPRPPSPHRAWAARPTVPLLAPPRCPRPLTPRLRFRLLTARHCSALPPASPLLPLPALARDYLHLCSPRPPHCTRAL
nr:apidaecins type 73-like [Aegilops tauschii subsp. strangulata]